MPQIAHQLFITENSAKEYLRRIRAKYGEAAGPAPRGPEAMAAVGGTVPA